MRYDFRRLESLPGELHEFPAWANFEHDAHGLHLWCRGGAGTGFMIERPRQYGTWLVRSRISAGLATPTTKVCTLLMERKDPVTGIRPWPPELDFNESGDRSASHQTLHTGPIDPLTKIHPEVHSGYAVDQTVTHTYGVTISETTIDYTCDGVSMRTISNLTPGTFWNLHVRTEPHDDPVSETVMDARWVEVPE